MAVATDDNSKFTDYAHPERLVSTDWLAGQLKEGTVGNRDLVVLESDEDVLLYDTGHIPGAVKVDWHTDLNDPVTRDYVNGERFAQVLGVMAGGLADDLASTVLLATDKPVLVAPAMNVRMWLHPATQANFSLLRSRGVLAVGPDEGAMACNEYGAGRMAEPAGILAAIEQALVAERPLAGRHVIVTSGPTHEPIDPVRYIANRSSGRQGHSIAAALAALGARVTLVSGPVSVPDPAGVTVRRIESAAEMLAACQAALPADAAVFAAAVADWRVANAAGRKIKKQSGAAAPGLDLVPNPDILATIAAAGPSRPRLVVGFAAETDDLVANAQSKLKRKNADWIVANDVSAETGIMGGAENEISLITAQGVEAWPRLNKQEVARRLAARIAEALK